ncbi:MAG: hypothetical protein KJ771_00340 [Nanoarchaeota archaeon]|nr:hypothetical protein [Nanoarchaeota archaeon]
MILSKKGKISWLFLILLFLFVPIVYSLGISPAIEEIKFEPALANTFKVQIFGETDPFEVKLSVSGELKDYITLSQEKLTVPSEGASFDYKINLPDELKPGRHKTSIVIEQQPKTSESGAGKSPFGAQAAVGHVIAINVPYQEKYAEATISVPNAKIGQPIDFVVTVTNFGNEDIINAQGIISILDDNDDKVIDIETGSSNIKQEERVKLYSHWTPKEVKPGIYKAKAVIDYDGKLIETETDFLIGDLFIDILDLNPKEIEQGKIQKLNINVKSFWSQEIEKIYASIDILKDNEKQETVSTPPINLEPWQTSSLTAFWDTTNYDPGEYNADITLNYGDKTTVKEFKLTIKNLEKPSSFPLLWITIVVIVGIVIFIIYLIKKKNKDETL